MLEDQNLTTYSKGQVFRPGLNSGLTEIRIVDHLVIQKMCMKTLNSN